MKRTVSTDIKGIRENVILFLLLLTSEDCLGVFHTVKRPEKLAFALSRMWFDDIYLAGERYFLGSFKGNHDPALVTQFQSQFNEKELKALERFHRFFELRVEMLSEQEKQRQVFPQNDSWKQIVKDAGYLVADLVGNPEEKREQLARFIAESLNKTGLRDPGQQHASPFLARLGNLNE